MRKALLAGVAALAIAGSTAVYAQHRPWSHHDQVRMSPEDRAAFVDARIAAVKAGLKLTPDQEKLWPPLEAAVRDFAKQRIDRANARMKAEQDESKTAESPVARLQQRAETMATTAAALKRIADAADPLYKTLDEGQKRRLTVLTRMGAGFGGEGWRHHRFEHGMDRDDDRGENHGGMDRGGMGHGGMNHDGMDHGHDPDRL